MTTVLVFNETEEGKRAPLYSLLGTISKVVFVDTPEILNDFVADGSNIDSKIITIIVDDMSFLVNIAFKGCVYLKFSSKEKGLSVDRVFFYNVVMNAQIQGVFVPNEDVLYEMCDRAFYFFLKSRRNKNGNFMLIDESMFFQNEIKYRVLSDVYNYYDASVSSYAKYNSQKVKTLIINLEKDVERKKYMTQLLPSFHDVEFQKAIYGKEYTLTPEESSYFRYTDMYAFQKKNPYACAYGDRKLKLAEIGCALSHINVWKKIVNMTYKGLIDEREPVCILEDDIQLSDNYSFKFNELISSLRTLGDLNDKWDVCFIGNSDDIPGIDILEEKNFKESVSLIKFNRLSKRTHGGGTFSYLINYYGAQKLLGCINKYGICQAIDWFMLEMCTEINMYKSFPHLITSEYVNSSSNIQ